MIHLKWKLTCGKIRWYELTLSGAFFWSKSMPHGSICNGLIFIFHFKYLANIQIEANEILLVFKCNLYFMNWRSPRLNQNWIYILIHSNDLDIKTTHSQRILDSLSHSRNFYFTSFPNHSSFISWFNRNKQNWYKQI